MPRGSGGGFSAVPYFHLNLPLAHLNPLAPGSDFAGPSQSKHRILNSKKQPREELNPSHAVCTTSRNDQSKIND